MGRLGRHEPLPTFWMIGTVLTRWPALYGAVAILCALMLVSDPSLPSGGLDPSWALANEHAARAGLVFGRDYIFSYGPLAFLSTKLYDPATFVFVIIGDIYLASLFVLPLFRTRGWAPALLYPAVVFLTPILPDPLFVAGALGLFTLALSRPSKTILLLSMLTVPFLFSKYSYAFVLLPLLAIVDLKHLVTNRRLPIFLPTLVLSAIFVQLLLKQPLAAIPELLGNVAEIIAGYGGAMQSLGRRREILAVIAAIAGLIGFTGWLIYVRWAASSREERLRDISYGMGLLWLIFILMKMGYVRHDGHVIGTWQSLVLAIPVICAYFAARTGLGFREGLAAILLAGSMGSLCLYLVRYNQTDRRPVSVATFARDHVVHVIHRPTQTLRWLSATRWGEANNQREAAEIALVREFPAAVRGSVDIIPYDIAPLVASGLKYRPRPVPQSYSSYTPRLQRLDADFFADTNRAPTTLLLKLGDIDGRLPTLASGPALPVVLRWYTPVGDDPLGVILRRRQAPRQRIITHNERRSVAIGEYVGVPAPAGDLTIARIVLPKTLFGSLFGLAVRQPILQMRVAFADGSRRTYRFIPAMAESEFVLSPLPTIVGSDGLSDAAPMFTIGRAPTGFARVTGFVIFGDVVAGWSFKRGEVTMQTIRLGS